MLEAMGVEYVILGHSERRQYFNETDEALNKKVKGCFCSQLNPSSLLWRNFRTKRSKE